MPDNVLKIGAEFDVGPIVAGAAQASEAFAKIAVQLTKEGESTAAVTSALENLGVAHAQAAAMANAAAEANVTLAATQEAVAVSTAEAAASMSGFERAAALAGGRLVGMEAGLGMAGGALARVASFLPGIGELFVYALPIALIAAAVDKIEEYEKELEKTDREMREFAIGSDEMAVSIDKENLKLEDQIAKLENRPAKNTLRIALIEAEEAAEKLSKGLEQGIQKANDLLNVGIGGSIFSLLTGGGRADEKAYAEPIQKIIDQIQNARQKLAEQPEGANPNAILQEEIGLYKQLQTVLRDSIRDMEAGQGSSQIHAKSVANFKEELIGAMDAVKSLGEQMVQTNLVVEKGALTQRKEGLDFWKTYSEGFKTVEADLAKHDEMWRKFWESQQTEAKRSADAMARIAEEGAREQSETLARITEHTTETNIQNARDDVAQIEEMYRKVEEEMSGAKGEHGDIFGDVLQANKAKEQIVTIDQAITDTDETIRRITNDIATLNRQPVLTSTDTASIDKYKEELRSLETLMQKLQQEQKKLQETSTKSWAQISKTIATDFTQAVNQVLTGHEKIGQAAAKLGQQLELYIIDQGIKKVVATYSQDLLQMLAAHIGFLANILGIQTTSSAAQVAQQKLTQVQIVEIEAGEAYAAGFASAMAALPFPANVAAAPAIASAAMAQTLEGLAFEYGGIVPGPIGSAVPIIAHAGERILPQAITNIVDNARTGGNTSNRSQTSISMENHFHKTGDLSENNIARIVSRGVRRGKIGR